MKIGQYLMKLRRTNKVFQFLWTALYIEPISIRCCNQNTASETLTAMNDIERSSVQYRYRNQLKLYKEFTLVSFM